jgi:hypothetical protein
MSSQGNTNQKEKCWRYHNTWLQTILQSHRNKNSRSRGQVLRLRTDVSLRGHMEALVCQSKTSSQPWWLPPASFYKQQQQNRWDIAEGRDRNTTKLMKFMLWSLQIADTHSKFIWVGLSNVFT